MTPKRLEALAGFEIEQLRDGVESEADDALAVGQEKQTPDWQGMADESAQRFPGARVQKPERTDIFAADCHHTISVGKKADVPDALSAAAGYRHRGKRLSHVDAVHAACAGPLILADGESFAIGRRG